LEFWIGNDDYVDYGDDDEMKREREEDERVEEMLQEKGS
jgi:hypothetical protein